jgi:hypothetical protein
LLPVKVLSRRFQHLFLGALEKACADGQLQFFAEFDSLRDPAAFARYLAPLRDQNWVVYAKPPFGGPAHVIEYLGRYTHRVAISNRRLLAMENDQVSYAWKDYRDGAKDKVMTVAAEEFIRLFLQHSLPPGFQRIRYYDSAPTLIARSNSKSAVNCWLLPLPSCCPASRFAAPCCALSPRASVSYVQNAARASCRIFAYRHLDWIAHEVAVHPTRTARGPVSLVRSAHR